jgi:hypothetical protein
MSATPQPLLASEALRDDLAPLEPALRTARRWCVGAALLFAALGVLPLVGLRGGGLAAALPSFVLAGIALIAALGSIPYEHRAFAMLALGALATAAGLFGAGPAAGILVDGGVWSTLRMAAAASLPAALLFRAGYRAYSGARWILGAAIALAIPFTVHAVLTILSANDAVILQSAGVLGVLAVLASLSGFMGSETTTVSWYTALGVVAAFAAELGLRAVHRRPLPPTLDAWSAVDVLAVATPTLAFAAVIGLSALGMYQLVAWRLARYARRIDLHRIQQEEKSAPQPSSPDWSTRA